MIRLAALALALLAWAPAGWARFDGLVEGPVAVPVAPDGGAATSLRLSGYLARPDRPGRHSSSWILIVPARTAAFSAAWSRSVWSAYAIAKRPMAVSKWSLVPR